MKHQQLRGGRIVLQAIPKPEKDEWGSALEAFQAALSLEKLNNEALLQVHDLAQEANDAEVGCVFLFEIFLVLRLSRRRVLKRTSGIDRRNRQICYQSKARWIGAWRIHVR